MFRVRNLAFSIVYWQKISEYFIVFHGAQTKVQVNFQNTRDDKDTSHLEGLPEGTLV